MKRLKLEGLKRRLQRWLLADNYSGVQIEPPPMRFIHDGVDYSLPPILPLTARQRMTASQLRTFLEANEQFRTQFATPYKTDLPISDTTDDPLYEWSWHTRQQVLTNTHAAAQRNPLAKAAVDYTVSFTIGDGFNLTCKNPDVEKVLQDFIDNPENDIRAYEKQAVRDLQVDGEIILRYYQQRGEVVVVPLRPYELQWIETDPGFFRRKVAFKFIRRIENGDSGQGFTSEEERIPAEDVQFVAINKHGYELRGRPELYTVLAWLRAYNDWLENRARLNHYLSAFVWDVSVETTSPTAIAQVAGRYRRPPAPGSVNVHSSKEVLEAKSAQVNANDAAEDGRQIKMMILAGMRMAEYMLGDGENANLATATAQQLPALTKFSDFQQIMLEQVWKPMFKRVLQAAIDAGLLPEEVEEYDSNGDPVYEEPEDSAETPNVSAAPRPDGQDAAPMDGYEAAPAPPADSAPPAPDAMPEMPPPMSPADSAPQTPKTPKTCSTLDAFEVSYEPISADSPSNIAQALQTYLQNEIIDLETAREEAGFDAAQIAKRMRKQREADLADMMTGRKPVPPGQMAALGMEPTGFEDDAKAQ